MEPFIGQIVLFGGNFAPRGWALCEGQLLSIAQNTALFAILGTIYGGDGRTTFALPDLRGRTPIGYGTGPGLTPRPLGSRAGQEYHTLTVSEMPNHFHLNTSKLSTDPASHETPIAGDVPAAAQFGAGLGATQVKSFGPATNTVDTNTPTTNAGGSQPHYNMQPYLTCNYIIALVGVFPSRN